MSSRKRTLAINNTNKSLNVLRENVPEIFSKTLFELGVNKSTRERLNLIGIKTLEDVYKHYDFIQGEYNFDGEKLTRLSRQIREICKKYLDSQSLATLSNKTVNSLKNTGKTCNFRKNDSNSLREKYSFLPLKTKRTLEELLEQNKVKAIAFKNGEIKELLSYSKKNRILNFSNGEEVCFYTIDSSISEYSLEKKAETKSDKTNYTKTQATKAIRKTTQKSVKTSPEIEALSNEIFMRVNDECCVCATFKELLALGEQGFMTLMEKQYKYVCFYPLEKSRKKSWRDEYRQLTQVFIPIFKRHDKNILNYHVLFEMKLPMDVKDLDSEEYIYADVVVVGDDGFVVLEFKQQDAGGVDKFQRQATKYIHRLRFHRIGRHQHHRYSYLVFTKENREDVWCYGDKKDFWFGNSKNVAKDMCYEFFDCTEPNSNIEEWMTAGFKQKWVKKK